MVFVVGAQTVRRPLGDHAEPATGGRRVRIALLAVVDAAVAAAVAQVERVADRVGPERVAGVARPEAVARITSESEVKRSVERGAYCARRQLIICGVTNGSICTKVTLGRPEPDWSRVLLIGLMTAPAKMVSLRSCRHAIGKPLRAGTNWRKRRAPRILYWSAMWSTWMAWFKRLFWSSSHTPHGLPKGLLMSGK